MQRNISRESQINIFFSYFTLRIVLHYIYIYYEFEVY